MAITSLFLQRVKFIAPNRTPPFTLELDASIEETHSTRNEITKHPIEEGADVADHVRPEPDTLQITGQISNHPLDKFDVTSFISGIPDPRRADTAYGELLAMQYFAERLTVVTTLNTYVDMVIVSLDVPRNAKLGNVVRFTATLEQIRTVVSDTVTAGTPDTALAQVKPKVAKGKKPGTVATEQQRSFAYNLLRP